MSAYTGGLATASQHSTIVNVNVARDVFQARSSVHESANSLDTDYITVFPASTDPEVDSFNKGELMWAVRGGMVGENGRTNVFTSFNSEVLATSDLDVRFDMSHPAGKAKFAEWDVDEKARTLLEEKYICVGVCPKDLPLTRNSEHMEDQPTLAIAGTFDVINAGLGDVRAMDILRARIPTMKERYTGGVKGVARNKVVGIVEVFNPRDVKPQARTFRTYFAVDSKQAAFTLPVSKRTANEANEFADAAMNSFRYAVLFGIWLQKTVLTTSTLNPEKVVGLVPIAEVERRDYTPTSGQQTSLSFLGEFSGMPFPKLVAYVNLGLDKEAAKAFAQQAGFSRITRDLAMNCLADFLAASNARLDFLLNTVIGRAVSSARPGEIFEMDVKKMG